MSGSRRKAGANPHCYSTNMTMTSKQGTIVAGGAALALALLLPTGSLPAWANLAVGSISVACGAVALYGALHWTAND